jgi:2-oxoglutarate dehydrogenase E2 component (dihydrolipoamide succinyltransferase)
MKIDMLMPQMGESITEATISRWLKNPGDAVEKDEIILEISTDKVDSEIPAPESGTLAEVLFKEGDVVPVKQKIAVIDTEGVINKTGAAASGNSSETPQKKQSSVDEAPNSAFNSPKERAPNTPEKPKENQLDTSSSPLIFSPLVKNLAATHNVPLNELNAVVGSGAGGRITKNDFLEHVARRGDGNATSSARVENAPQSQTTSVPKVTTPSPTTAAATTNAGGGMASIEDWSPEGTKIIPMDRMRQAIAEHMVRSKHTSPHVYSVQEIDVSKISKFRAQHKAAFAKAEGFNLSFTPFFLEGVVRAIQKFPAINSSVDGKSIVMKKNVNLGCAVALGTTGLIVPVIKRSEELGLVGIARALNDLAKRARDKKLLPDDVAGGTFTVTNPGVFGTVIGTPIINQPQVAILCLGAIKKRPVVVDDMIAIREMCYLTLSYDHRVIDGSLSGNFLAYLTSYLENWDLNQPLR